MTGPKDVAYRGVAFTTAAVSQMVLPRNPRRIALWLGSPNANRGSYSFGGADALDAGVYQNSLTPGTWVYRRDIGDVITQEIWHIASGATSCGVAEFSECMCEDEDDL